MCVCGVLLLYTVDSFVRKAVKGFVYCCQTNCGHFNAITGCHGNGVPLAAIYR